jgi:protein-disulfide isomerase
MAMQRRIEGCSPSVWMVIGIGLGAVLALVAIPAPATAASEVQAILEALERGPGASKGRIGAPVTIVEFSDFQCRYCRKFWEETLPRLEERYIRAGKVRFVYRHLAVLGPPSVQAAVAAECAHDQGKFWPYHDRLFANAGPLAFTAKNLKAHAEAVGLETSRFATCLDDQRPRQKVEQETIIARTLGFSGTPGFLIDRQPLMGAQPFALFERIIEDLLRDPARRQ